MLLANQTEKLLKTILIDVNKAKIEWVFITVRRMKQ